MSQRWFELPVGLLIIAAGSALTFLAFKVSNLHSFWDDSVFHVTASFANIGDLKPRAPVTIAGVRVGEVEAVDLNQKNFKGTAYLTINKQYNQIPRDSEASIFTQGLLGGNYISLTPGFSEEMLQEGDNIAITHPALILENLIGQFLFSANKDSKEKKSD